MYKRQQFIIRTALIVALGGFLMGFDASVISGVNKFIEIQFNLTKLELGWAVGSLTLTATLAMMVSGPLSDKYGRRLILKIAATLYFISAVGSAFAPSFLFLVIARMIGGIGVGASLILAPMYIAEISPPNLRGRMVSFNQLNIVIGISVAFFTNYLILQWGKSDAAWTQALKFDEYNWRWMLGLEMLPAILYFFGLYLVPKSPRWLIMKGKFDEALKIMKRANDAEVAEKELEEVRASIHLSPPTKEKPNLKDLLKDLNDLLKDLLTKIGKLFQPRLRLVVITIGAVVSVLQQIIGVVVSVLQQITGINKDLFTKIGELFQPSLRLVITIGVVVSVLQQITGINSVFFYAPMIFEQSGIGTDASFSQAILVGVVNLVFTILAIAFIDKLGRKPLLVFGVSGIVICMSILAYGFGQATYTLTEESIEQLPKDIDRTALGAMVDKTYENDLLYKAAIDETLGDEVVKKYESNLITASVKLNPTIILVGILGFVACFAISIGPVMWVLFSELFPNQIRGFAISFVGFINSTVSFLVQVLFPWELTYFGNSTTFLLYGIFAVFGLIFIIWKVPETKGKSLEELEKILVKT